MIYLLNIARAIFLNSKFLLCKISSKLSNRRKWVAHLLHTYKSYVYIDIFNTHFNIYDEYCQKRFFLNMRGCIVIGSQTWHLFKVTNICYREGNSINQEIWYSQTSRKCRPQLKEEELQYESEECLIDLMEEIFRIQVQLNSWIYIPQNNHFECCSSN